MTQRVGYIRKSVKTEVCFDDEKDSQTMVIDRSIGEESESMRNTQTHYVQIDADRDIVYDHLVDGLKALFGITHVSGSVMAISVGRRPRSLARRKLCQDMMETMRKDRVVKVRKNDQCVAVITF